MSKSVIATCAVTALRGRECILGITKSNNGRSFATWNDLCALAVPVSSPCAQRGGVLAYGQVLFL